MEGSIREVDFHKLSEEEEERKKLREACEKSGYFRIINHPISHTLMADMKSVAKFVHDLPYDIKMSIKPSFNGSGFRPPLQLTALYESMGIYDIYASPQNLQDFFSLLNLPPHHRQIIETYAKAIHDLASSVSQKMAESLGIEGLNFEDRPFVLRTIKYNFSPDNIGILGVPTHSDATFITVLQDDETVPGLEMMDDSGSLKAVTPKQGAFTCIVGDVGHVWSNGIFRNAMHRVVCKEASPGYSIGLFMSTSRDDNVEAPEKLVGDDHARLYRPFKFTELWDYRIMTGKRAGGEVLDQYRIA